MLIIKYSLFFLAGVCLHMSILHYFVFAETASHPMIRMWKYPKLASSIWGGIQLAFGLLILYLYHYQFNSLVDTSLIFTGFAIWGIFRAIILERKGNKK